MAQSPLARRRPQRGKELRVFEYAVILVLAAIIAWQLFARFPAIEAQGLTTLARMEQDRLGTQLQLYYLNHSTYPPDLRTLFQEQDIGLEAPAQRTPQRKELFNDQGRLLDPFGRPYRYNPDKGRVQSPSLAEETE